ncbi:sulfurtransferase [Lacicoccus alkaliphilus]|uniref:Thiosulfate/3-mercaptopyruvate sulfurtransferase n=1 Tax=Lacicoccus alkaliphilus DSM 16010 TaxID=1123231 RepID=A0A1M7FFR5_9BACL|nr:sulfurtransferase [Salinicoccus alkaliphilus]SHM02497.1 thiosulfate/3-mercaptopyruvate sulfurtransferase [Salinicoccus alkaliphilus DSM 16010]
MAVNHSKFVSTEWLEDHLEDEDLKIIDATTYLQLPEDGGYYKVWSGREDYEEAHIPGAVFADLKNDFSDPDVSYNFAVIPHDEFVEKISDLGISDGSFVVIYDRGAMVDADFEAADWASRLAWQLKFEGFDNVAILDGGYNKWKREGRPVTSETVAPEKGELNIERRPELYAGKEEVLKAIDDDDVIILDSLDPSNYAGESDTYARPGRIKGAVNVFFGDLADPETGEVYDDEKLKERFEAVGALDEDKKVITYCGSAIAATWTQYLLNKLGQDDVAVYDGSLSEWAADESLPMETGDPK